MREIRGALSAPLPKPDPALATRALDDAFADLSISKAMEAGSWSRIASWVKKFRAYVASNNGDGQPDVPVAQLLSSDRWAVSFLARVLREDPKAKTRVDAAKRAINHLRAFAKAAPLDDNVMARLLSRTAKRARVSTVRKAAKLELVFIQAIANAWGLSDSWWRRQVALMVLLAFCAIARGGGMCSCLRAGVTWVRADGTMVHDPEFIPSSICRDYQCKSHACIRGFLLLLPFRKNKIATPSWMPIMEITTIRLLCQHLRWLRRLRIPGKHMFVARKKFIRNGVHGFSPSMSSEKGMSVNSLRTLVRQAVRQCGGVTEQQAALFGTHSMKNGAIEALRSAGADSETRKQLGDWMSPEVALSYLQLTPASQFNLIRSIR